MCEGKDVGGGNAGIFEGLLMVGEHLNFGCVLCSEMKKMLVFSMFLQLIFCAEKNASRARVKYTRRILAKNAVFRPSIYPAFEPRQ